MKYLIIDDEFMAHDIIKGYCDLLPNLELAKNCYDALEAIDYLNKNEVQLIFLDLNMPKLKGFDFLRTLAAPPKVIVTTAYQEFAVEGYELNIIDYLLKPFSFERFLKAVNKAMDATATPAPIPSNNPTVQRIFLRTNKKHIQVAIDAILYMESAGNYLKVVTAEKTITVREKISDLVNQLPDEDFIRVHKSFAVATQHIEAIEGNRILIGGAVVPVGMVYKLRVAALLR